MALAAQGLTSDSLHDHYQKPEAWTIAHSFRRDNLYATCRKSEGLKYYTAR